MKPALVPGPRPLRRGALPRPAPLDRVPPAADPPTAAEIAERAYAIFAARGGEHGHDVEDWLEAERALTAARSAAASTGGAA